MSSDAAEAFHYQQTQAAQNPHRMTTQESKIDEGPFYIADTIRIRHLEEPLLRLVPPHLRETGMLAMSSECDPQNLAAIDDFRLERLAASIRSAMGSNHGEPGDLHALLRRYDAGNRWLSEEEERTIARLLVHRVLNSSHRKNSESVTHCETSYVDPARRCGATA